MDIWWKAAGTAITVAMVLITARRAHRRLAGMVAAFPTVTAPALLWLDRDQGAGFAAAAAVATVASCLMQAGFALGYARASCRGGPAVALGCGLAAAAVLTGLALAVGGGLAPAACAAAAGVALCRRWMPRTCVTGSRRLAKSRGGLGEVALTVAAAALLSTAAASLGAAWGPFAAGLLASLPVVCGTVAVVEHARHGHAAAGDFLHAYIGGLFGRVLFGTSFALAVPSWGAGWALLLATALSLAAAAGSCLPSGLPGPVLTARRR